MTGPATTAATAALHITESEYKETAGGKHRNKTQFLRFFLPLAPHTRGRLLYSALKA